MATRGLKNLRAYGAFIIYLIGLLSNGEGAADLGSATAVDDPVVAHQVPDDAESVMHGPLGLLNDHFGAATQEDGHRLGVEALLDHQHPVLRTLALEIYCQLRVFRISHSQ